MKEILDTTQLILPRSTFLVDLVKHTNNHLYVEVTQIFHKDEEERQIIKINPRVLSDLILVLTDYRRQMSDNQYDTGEILHQKIISNYLKGMSIEALARLYEKTEAYVEMVLFNSGLAITSQEQPKYKKRRRWRKR